MLFVFLITLFFTMTRANVVVPTTLSAGNLVDLHNIPSNFRFHYKNGTLVVGSYDMKSFTIYNNDIKVASYTADSIMGTESFVENMRVSPDGLTVFVSLRGMRTYNLYNNSNEVVAKVSVKNNDDPSIIALTGTNDNLGISSNPMCISPMGDTMVIFGPRYFGMLVANRNDNSIWESRVIRYPNFKKLTGSSQKDSLRGIGPCAFVDNNNIIVGAANANLPDMMTGAVYHLERGCNKFRWKLKDVLTGDFDITEGTRLGSNIMINPSHTKLAVVAPGYNNVGAIVFYNWDVSTSSFIFDSVYQHNDVETSYGTPFGDGDNRAAFIADNIISYSYTGFDLSKGVVVFLKKENNQWDVDQKIYSINSRMFGANMYSFKNQLLVSSVWNNNNKGTSEIYKFTIL